MKMGLRWLVLVFLGCVKANVLPMFGEITSPNYPQGYPNNAKESWGVQVPEGYGIRLYFIHLDIEPSDGCEYDSLQVIIGEDVQETLCGRSSDDAKGFPIKERYYPSTELKLVFTSDFSNQERHTGFSAYYIAVDVDECEDNAINSCSHFCNNYIGGYFCSCPPEYDLHEDQQTCGVNCSGGLYTELRGQITSPGYPSPYPENSLCEYKVILESGYQVIITFQATDFDIEETNDGSCSYDSLTIKAKGRKFGPYCGKSPPARIETASNEVDIIFRTDSGGDNRGWKLRYFEEAIPCPNKVTSNSILDPQNDKYTFKDMVTVRCEEGYEVVKGTIKLLAFQAKCQEDGTWSNSHLLCKPVDCGVPEELEFGSAVAEFTTYQSEATYSCNSDYYTLLGEETYRCSLDGLWVNSTGQSVLPVCKPVCGRSTLELQSKIYGGAPAENGYFPWAVFFPSGQLGGGSLISDQWVLTAAHLAQSNPSTLLAGDVLLRKATDLKVKKVILHPNWIIKNNDDRTNFDNDIALIQLVDKFEMGPCIAPICMPDNVEDSSPDIDEIGYVAGWGKTSDNSNRKKAPKLLYASVSVRETENCKKSVVTNQVFTENMICAGGNGNDSCHGDSGGPLMFRYLSDEVHDDKGFYIGGIVSWGIKCGSFGMYTRVKNYLEWIKETIQITEQEDADPKTDPLKICKENSRVKRK